MVRLSGFSNRYMARRAQDVMVDTIEVHRPKFGTFNPTTGMSTADESVKIYQGKARIYSVEGPQIIDAGEDILTSRQTYISIPADSSPLPRRDDIVVILDAVSDESLDRKVFRVMDVGGGGLVRAVRRMLCVGLEESSTWGQ